MNSLLLALYLALGGPAPATNSSSRAAHLPPHPTGHVVVRDFPQDPVEPSRGNQPQHPRGTNYFIPAR